MLVKTSAACAWAADSPRGAADWNGQGEVVSGIVVMRHGENALDVIERVEERIDELRRTLPEGVEIVPVYDRSRPHRARDRHAQRTRSSRR